MQCFATMKSLSGIRHCPVDQTFLFCFPFFLPVATSDNLWSWAGSSLRLCGELWDIEPGCPYLGTVGFSLSRLVPFHCSLLCFMAFISSVLHCKSVVASWSLPALQRAEDVEVHFRLGRTGRREPARVRTDCRLHSS